MEMHLNADRWKRWALRSRPIDVQVESLDFVIWYWTCKLSSAMELLAACSLCMEIWWAEHQWPLASDWSGIWMDLLWPTRLSISSYSTYTDAMDNTISQNLLAEPRRMLQLLNAVRAEWKITANILSVWLLKLCLSGSPQTTSDSVP